MTLRLVATVLETIVVGVTNTVATTLVVDGMVVVIVTVLVNVEVGVVTIHLHAEETTLLAKDDNADGSVIEVTPRLTFSVGEGTGEKQLVTMTGALPLSASMDRIDGQRKYPEVVTVAPVTVTTVLTVTVDTVVVVAIVTAVLLRISNRVVIETCVTHSETIDVTA